MSQNDNIIIGSKWRGNGEEMKEEHKQIVRYKEEKDSLVAEFTDGSIVRYEKPRINVFEKYGTMVYFNNGKSTVLIINNIFSKHKFDYVELKEKTNEY